MIITQTDKDIIKIIEPYMNKSLSEGVLFEKNVNYKKDWSIWKDIFSVLSIISEENEVAWVYFAVDWYKDEQPEVYYIWVEEFYDNWFKILWHYDITAVLKYIEKKTIPNHIMVNIYSQSIVIEKFKNCEEKYWEELIKLPNKPLHLYTEQEEKDLLELLQELNV